LYIKHEKDNNRYVRVEVHNRKDHNINIDDIDKEAIKIISRLHNNGYSAYIVGGAIRDLLFGHKPEDFDISTNAKPFEIKKIFKNNSFLIGKRFKINHIVYVKRTEVSTFRDYNYSKFGDKYGDIYQDFQGRDFTINSLYYDPIKQIIFDYTKGIEDIKNRILKTNIDLEDVFSDDPIRIIRAIRYSVLLDLNIEKKLNKQIKKDCYKIINREKIRDLRLTDQFHKILTLEKYKEILFELLNYKVIQNIFYTLDFNKKDEDTFRYILFKEDSEFNDFRFQSFIKAIFFNKFRNFKNTEDIYEKLKNMVLPIVISNEEVEIISRNIFKQEIFFKTN